VYATINAKMDVLDQQVVTVLIALITVLAICSETVYVITDGVDNAVRHSIATSAAASQLVLPVTDLMPVIVSSALITPTRTCMALVSAQSIGQVYPVLSV
jgi:hypothetical protein